jgi:hypothetical protein
MTLPVHDFHFVCSRCCLLLLFIVMCVRLVGGGFRWGVFWWWFGTTTNKQQHSLFCGVQLQVEGTKGEWIPVRASGFTIYILKGKVSSLLLGA